MVTQTRESGSNEPLMTEKETAAYLRIKPRQLFNWRMDGLVPYMRIGRAIRYRRSTIDAALERLSSSWSSA